MLWLPVISQQKDAMKFFEIAMKFFHFAVKLFYVVVKYVQQPFLRNLEGILNKNIAFSHSHLGER